MNGVIKMTEKVLITGGAGYIGSHTTVELAAAGFEPVIVDNFSNSDRDVVQGISEIIGKPVTCHEADCTNKEALQRILDLEGAVAGVIHFAAYKQVGESVEKPEMYFHNNVGSLKVLLEVMKETGLSNLVFSSSCTVYGQPEKLPVDETAPANSAQSPYGQTKIDCENLIFNTPDLSSVILRYFNPIGAHASAKIGELPIGKPANLVPALTRVASTNGTLTINGNTYPTPDGTCIRDYLHVVDLAKAHVLALNWLLRSNTANTEVFNLGVGRGYSVSEVVNTFEKVNGIAVNKQIGPKREGDIVEIFADASKAAQVLNWKPEKTMDDALRDAWEWQQKLDQ